MNSIDNTQIDDIDLKSAVKLTPLQLNGILLDVRHTILTPDYLERLIQSKSNPDQEKPT